jgi:hypothetical protein
VVRPGAGGQEPASRMKQRNERGPQRYFALAAPKRQAISAQAICDGIVSLAGGIVLTSPRLQLKQGTTGPVE